MLSFKMFSLPYRNKDDRKGMFHPEVVTMDKTYDVSLLCNDESDAVAQMLK